MLCNFLCDGQPRNEISEYNVELQLAQDRRQRVRCGQIHGPGSEGVEFDEARVWVRVSVRVGVRGSVGFLAGIFGHQ